MTVQRIIDNVQGRTTMIELIFSHTLSLKNNTNHCRTKSWFLMYVKHTEMSDFSQLVTLIMSS